MGGSTRIEQKKCIPRHPETDYLFCMEKPVAIVLGAAVWPGGVPSPALRRRAEKAAALYRAGDVDGIVATGGIGQQPPSEAAAICDVVTGLGVPRQAVILEDRSTTTIENLENARRLIPPGTPVIIVSDRWHLPRARLVARRRGLSAAGAAPSLKSAHWGRVFLAVLREAAALAWYFVRPMR